MDPQEPDPRALLAILEARFTPRILEACKKIRQTQTDTPWYNDVLVGLALRCYSLQEHLKRGYKESDAHYMSWAARTLLELKVWSVYVTTSEDNVKRFHQDMYVDANTAFRVGTKTSAALEDHPLKTAGQSILHGIEWDLKAKLQAAEVSESQTYLNPRTVAKHLHLDIEFDIANMTFSKWAHATGQSVLLPLYETGKPNSKCDLFLLMGTQNAVLIIETLTTHLKERGLPTFET